MSKQLYLAHHGILGMKWGVRRYQNEDGTLTKKGKKRYSIDGDGNLQKKPMATGKKVAIGVGAVATAALAARTIAYMKYKKKLMSDSKNVSQTIKKGKDFISATSKIPSNEVEPSKFAKIIADGLEILPLFIITTGLQKPSR